MGTIDFYMWAVFALTIVTMILYSLDKIKMEIMVHSRYENIGLLNTLKKSKIPNSKVVHAITLRFLK